MVDKLEACTWCGHEGVLHCSSDGEVEWVRCVHCGRESPLAYSAAEAIRRWNAGEVRNTRATPANGEQVGRAAYRMAYAPLRSAQHAFDIIARGTPHISAVQELAREESERIGIAIATLSTPTEDARERVLEEAVHTILARCEALEDEAYDAMRQEPLDPAYSFHSGQKQTAKSIRRHLHDLTRTALGNKETDRHG